VIYLKSQYKKFSYLFRREKKMDLPVTVTEAIKDDSASTRGLPKVLLKIKNAKWKTVLKNTFWTALAVIVVCAALYYFWILANDNTYIFFFLCIF
jgi:hypothetical protein